MRLIHKILAPLLSLFVFALCSGFFISLTSLAMHVNHEHPLVIGAMSSAFFIGLICGSFRMGIFIQRVGHIRAFSTFASALAVISLLQGLLYNVPLWFIWRFLTGVGTAGIFITVESWLLHNSTAFNRGRVLSLYMIIYYASEALGQFLLNLGHPSDLLHYAVAAMLCSLSVIPLSITRAPLPPPSEPSNMALYDLFQKSPSAFIGCILAGMILGTQYSLFPVLFQSIFQNTSQVSTIMFSLIFGSMVFQYPVGKLSDTFDRRLTVILVCLTSIAASLALMSSLNTYYLTLLFTLILGGLSTTIYPICISHACDVLESKDIVSAIQGLLLAFGIGSSVGPILAPFFMQHNTLYLFIYFVAIFGAIATLFALRRLQKESPPKEEPFQVMRHSTPVMAEIDPRGKIKP